MDKEYCRYGQERLDAVEFEDTPIAHAVFDKKPLKVTMEEMIAAGYFTQGEDFCFRDGVKVAALLKDGKLLYNGDTIDMHSCAAAARGVKAKRLNGFDHWYVLRDGAPVSIADIRERYRTEI